jgi:hypothetical protein
LEQELADQQKLRGESDGTSFKPRTRPGEHNPEVSKLEEKKSKVEKIQREKMDRFLPLQEEVLNQLYLVLSHLQTEEETLKEEAKEAEYPEKDMSMIN